MTKEQFVPIPGQKYKCGDKILVLIPNRIKDSYIGKVIEGSSGWIRVVNSALFPEDYISDKDDTFWGFTPCHANLIEDVENYQIY